MPLTRPSNGATPNLSIPGESDVAQLNQYADLLTGVMTDQPVTIANTFIATLLKATGISGATAASRWAGATATGVPTSGTFQAGDWGVNQAGALWVATAAGNASYSAATLAAAPSGYWRLNDTSTPAVDGSGSGNSATFNGTPTTGVAGATSDGDTAMSFNGSTDYLSVGAGTGLSFASGSPYSLRLWAKLSSTTGILAMLVRRDPAATGLNYALQFETHTVKFYVGPTALSTGTIDDDNLWHHYVGTYDGTNGRFYKDSVLKAGPTAGTPAVVGGQVTEIARDPWTAGHRYYPGSLDEVAIYPSALSQAQITADYQAGLGLFALTNPPSGPYGSKTSLTVGPSQVNLQSAGADMSGATFSDAAWSKALTQLPGGQGVIGVPPGNPKFNAQIVADGVFLQGAGRIATTLNFPAQLGVGVPAIILKSTAGAYIGRAEDLTIYGPGSYASPNTNPAKSANCDGIRLDDKVYLRHVQIRFFDSGVVLNSPTGHQTLEMVNAGNCYYGYYVLQQGQDNQQIDCDFTGNMFASVACAGTQYIEGLWVRCHVGFSPYGFYQESGAAGSFLNGTHMLDVHHEQCGNGMWYTEQWNTSGKGQCHGVYCLEPGHSISTTTYRRTDRDADYAIRTGAFTGTIIEPDATIQRYLRGDLKVGFGQTGFLYWERRTPNPFGPAVSFATNPEMMSYLAGGVVGIFKGTFAITNGTSTVVVSGSRWPGNAIKPRFTLTALGGVAPIISYTGYASSPALGAPANGGVGNPPMTAVQGAAGNVDVGAHTYVVTYVNQFGETIGGASVTMSVTSSAKHVSLSVIPTCDVPINAASVTRNIYRSKAGTTTPLFRIAASPTLNDNATTTFDDNVADASLNAAQVPVADTTEGFTMTVTSNVAASGSSITGDWELAA